MRELGILIILAITFYSGNMLSDRYYINTHAHNLIE